VLPLLGVELDPTNGVSSTDCSVPPVSLCPAGSWELSPTTKAKTCELAVLRAIAVELSPTEEIAADETEAWNPAEERNGISARAGARPAGGVARTARLMGRAEPAVPSFPVGALAAKDVCPFKLGTLTRPVATELKPAAEACGPWLDASALGEGAAWPGPEAAAGLPVVGDAMGAWDTGVTPPTLRALGAFPRKTAISNGSAACELSLIGGSADCPGVAVPRPAFSEAAGGTGFAPVKDAVSKGAQAESTPESADATDAN
jgi:hypothetical protein